MVIIKATPVMTPATIHRQMRFMDFLTQDHIALDLIYSWLPIKVAFIIRQFWTTVIFFLGVVMIIYGIEAVSTMGGKYWEMWYFAW
jgi:TRAP-type C4-dicarboxylate transport system permease small subunit